jgi:hypothetical protein
MKVKDLFKTAVLVERYISMDYTSKSRHWNLENGQERNTTRRSTVLWRSATAQLYPAEVSGLRKYWILENTCRRKFGTRE